MDTETTLAVTAALVTLVINAAAAAYAGLCWWRVEAYPGVWGLIRAGQIAAAAQAVLAGGLAVAGYRPDDGLYWLYALLPVAIGVIGEQLRIQAAEQVLDARGLPDAQAVGTLPDAGQRSVVLAIVRREIGVMALAALVVTFLALRGALIA